jgi:protein Mpv17
MLSSNNRSNLFRPQRTARPFVHRKSSTSRAAFIDVSSGLSAIGALYKTRPFLAGFITCAIKAAAADMVAQKSDTGPAAVPEPAMSPIRSNGRFYVKQGGAIALGDNRPLGQRFNYLRNLSFLLYGGIYCGMAQEFIYNHIFPALFGNGKTMGRIFIKVMADLLFVGPLLTLPICYLVKTIVFRKTLADGMGNYLSDIKENGLLKKFWSVWFPVQCLTFSVIPDHLKIAFMAGVSFFWMIIFSANSST